MNTVLEQKIIRMDLWHCQMPVNSRRDHGIGSVVGTVDVVVVRLVTESGLQGFGEASPWPVFNGTAEASMAAFDRYFKPHVLGKRIGDWASIMQVAQHVVVDCNDAKAALETALLDLAGRALGVPIAQLLGGQIRERLPLSASIANPDFDADLAFAERLREHGVGIVKVKTGFKSHAFDVMRIETLQKQFPEFDIRVDYNQGLEPFDAIRKLRDVDAMGVTFIEQPVAARHWQCMHAIKQAIQTPLLADESVFTPSDMVRAVAADICDAVSVKIMKSGGLVRGREIASIAEAAGIAAYGGDMFETGIAHMAGAQLVASCQNISLGCEYYQASFFLEKDLLNQPFPLIDGQVVVPAAPGLGVEVDTARLQEFAVASLSHQLSAD